MEENGANKQPCDTEEEVKDKEAGSGWGGWGLSMFSDIKKAAAAAAEEISRTAMEAAKSAAKEVEDLQAPDSDSESAGEGGVHSVTNSEGNNEESDMDFSRKSALDKLENASEDSLLGQGLKVIDTSVETFASNAWGVLGNAWKGGADLVTKLELSADNLTDSIQHDSSAILGSSILESGKNITYKGMEMLERAGKETMELIISETGFDVDNDLKNVQSLPDEQFEEVTFDRCFYIYGGPDHLEELETLSNHYALLFNRRKAKLVSEQKSFYVGKLKQVQEIFNLSVLIDADVELDKGKAIKATEDNGNELKTLRNASVSRAADMAAGFASSLGGLASNEVMQKTENRLEGIHSEGIHRLSELCCFAVSHLVTIGKSIISNSKDSYSTEDALEISVKINWPEDSVLKAKMIRLKVESMKEDIEAISNGFITGISDIIEAYSATIKGCSTDGDCKPTSVQEKGHAISKLIRTSQQMALEKVQDGLQYLAFVTLSTSMPAVTA